ncbi:MAG: GNAT family N-acetyltransferase [Chitinophagia bacterium]
MSDLLLRPWQMTDAAVLVEIANNSQVYKWLRDAFPVPYTYQDAVNWILHAGKHHPPESFAVVKNGVLTGSVGWVPGTDIYRKSCEIGYFIGEPYWGLGIATEAVYLLTQHISSLHAYNRIQAKIFMTNLSSARVLEKNGFTLEAVHQLAVFKNNQIMDEQVWVKIINQTI